MAAKKKTTEKSSKNPTPYVVVRTYPAVVHVGTLVRQSDDGKRVSETVSAIELTEAIEVIACTPAGQASLESASWLAS